MPEADFAILGQLFPELSPAQIALFERLPELYAHWNSQINVISRKDMDHFLEHHIIHSLALTRYIKPKAGQRIIDIGTGGGFPGIPMAIYYPDVRFTLVDSIGKKIKVVQEIAEALNLRNVRALNQRAETVTGLYDFAVSRAVARLSMIVGFCTQSKMRARQLYCLKGGELREEIEEVDQFPTMVYQLAPAFSGEFFETKKVIYVQLR